MPLPRSVLYGSALYHLSLWGPAPGALAIALDDAWPGNPARGAALLAGELRFSGEVLSGNLPPWTASMRSEFLAELHSLRPSFGP